MSELRRWKEDSGLVTYGRATTQQMNAKGEAMRLLRHAPRGVAYA
jgi:hypothetical protein